MTPEAHNAHCLGEVLTAKRRLAKHSGTVAELNSQIGHLEAELSRIDPQRVVACVVPGYTDPPERIAAAERDRQAGIVSVLTPEHGAMIARGEMEPPELHLHVPHFSQIHIMKRHVVSLAAAVRFAISSDSLGA